MTKVEFNRARAVLLDRLRRDSRLTPAARLIGWEIFMHANFENGLAWPSHDRLQDLLGLGLRTVKLGVQQLAKHGAIEIEKRGRKNFYLIGADFTPVTSAKGAETGAPTGAPTGATKGARSDHYEGEIRPAKGAGRDPLSSYPTSKEPADPHQHQHHLDDGDADAVAAALLNHLIRLARVPFRDNAHTRGQLKTVRSWLADGMPPQFILYWAEVQMERRQRGSCSGQPITTVAYFEKELRKEHGKSSEAAA